MWAGALRDKKETGPSLNCHPVGSEVGAKPSGSILEGGFSHPREGEAARERVYGGRKPKLTGIQLSSLHTANSVQRASALYAKVLMGRC